MATINDKKVITGKVRFSYAHVFKPEAMEGEAEPKYKVTLLIPKTDKTTVGRIEAAIKQAAEDGKNTKFGGKIPKFDSPLRDGDEEKPDDENYAGCMFIQAKSKQKPGVVDNNLDPILDETEFYSGCYGRASISFFPYNTVNKGVGCLLIHVQKLADGKPFAGGSRAEDDFATPYDELM